MVIIRRLVCVWVVLAPTWIASAASGSTPPPLVVFSRDGSNAPHYSVWNGSAWSSPASTPSIGGNAFWVVTRSCPTRDETVCLTLDDKEKIKVMFFRAGGWDSPVQLAEKTDQKAHRVCDAGYEQLSGNCLIVYYDDNNSNMGYHIGDGMTLSGKQNLSRPGNAKVNYVALTPRPDTNDVFLLAADQNNRLYANRWNGSAWDGWTTITTSLNGYTTECFALAFESLSGKGLLVYGQSNQNRPRYRVWNGGWSSEESASSLGGTQQFIRLAPDPKSDQIAFACLTDKKHIRMNVWNGSSLENDATATTNAPDDDIRNFDVAFEAGGGRPMIVYTLSSQSALRYSVRTGTSWSEATGPNIGEPARIVQLRTGTAAGEVFVAVSDTNDDLTVHRWTGSSFASSVQLDNSLGGDPKSEQFMLSVPQAKKRVKIIHWSEVRNKAAGS